MENDQDIIKNRHRFRTFAQQIALINPDINTAFELNQAKPGDSDSSTFFYTTMLSSLQRNFNQSYIELTNELLPISRTLHLILYNKDKIFKLIINYLKKPYSEIMGGIQNVLNLISQLARDLRNHFYPYFNEIFKNLANLFTPYDAQYIDDFFKCISFLLRYLQKYLIQDIENVLNLFVEFYFAQDKDFLRKLSAHCLAHLIKQSPSKKETHLLLFNIVSKFLSSDNQTSGKDNISNESININPNPTEEEDDSDDEDDNEQINPKKNKTYAVNMEVKKMTKREKVIQTLSFVLYYEIKNVQNSLWSNASELIAPFLQVREKFVYEAFLQMIEKVANHVTPLKPSNQKDVQKYLQSLSEKLPQINIVLTFRTFLILMDNKNQQNNNYARQQQTSLFQNSDILINVLSQSGKKCPIDILCQFLAKLNNFTIQEKDNKTISDIITFIISKSIENQNKSPVNIKNENIFDNCNYTFDTNFVLTELKDSKKIAEISSEEIVKYAELHFSEVLPFLNEIFTWSTPQSLQITDKLINKANEAFLSNRDTVIPLFKYLHNSATYEKVKSLKDLSLSEYGVLFTLMSLYDKDLLIDQPSKFIEYLLKKSGSDSINSEEALKILYHLLHTCSRLQPEWMKIDSQMFATLFDKINFNTPNKELQSIGSSILSLFLDKEKEIRFMNGDELIVKATESIFNLKIYTSETTRYGESMIDHLTTAIAKMRSIDRLFNVSLGFARCNYIRFRDFDSQLIAEIINFNPQKYGPLVTKELDNTFPWRRDPKTNADLFARTLFMGIQKAKYINEEIVNIIVRFCQYEAKSNEDEEEIVKTKVSLLDTLAEISKDPKYNDKVEEIGFEFLKSINGQIRKASLGILYNIKIVPISTLNIQKKEKIKSVLDVFVNGENIPNLVTFSDFLEEFKFHRPFLTKVAVYLSIGTVREFLSEKKRMKNKYRTISSQLLQALSYLETEEISPLIQSFLVPNPTASDYRRFPKYFVPMIKRIPMHLGPFLDGIIKFLLTSLERSSINTREMNNSMNACSLFFESFSGYENFAQDCLSVLDKRLTSQQQSVIRLTKAISAQFPSLFSNHDEAVEKIIAKLKEKATPDLIEIITRIITEIPKYHDNVIDTFKDILTNSKLMKSEKIWQSFNIFLSFMKESFATPKFIDLLITFLVNYRHIETIPIAHGITLSKEQFSDLSKLIAYPLTPEFRTELIPLIAESIEEKYSEAFLKLNKDDLSEKALTYRSLDSAGDFSFIFALQSFSDLQLDDFSLRAATVGFLSRVIQHTPSIVTDYVLPAIKFHVKKEHSRIPPNEILIILNTIIKTVPDINLPMIRILSEQPFFLSLGSFDPKIREDAIEKFTAVVKEKDDWDTAEVSEIVFPLIAQLSTTEGIENALSCLCNYANETVIKRLLRRLIRSINHGSTIHLLVALCKANAFQPNDVVPELLKIIVDPKKPPAIQLRLIPALLSVDHSKNVVHQIIASIAPKLPSKKEEKRKIGQQSLTELVKTLSKDDYFILFQDLRNFLKEGRQIPVLFISLNNMLVNAVNGQGSFDSFITLFSDVLLEDIFGYMGEMRKQKGSEIPEAKKCMSFDSFKYLAKYVTFKPTSRDLIDSILNKFKTLRTIDQSKGARRIILFISQGFVDNETVDAETLVNTIGYLLDLSDEIKKEDEKREQQKNDERVAYGKKYEEDFFIEKPKRSAEENDGTNEITKKLGNNYLPSLMAVSLLNVFFERDLFDVNDKAQVDLLETLLKRLWDFIKRAKDTETLIISLSILEHYITLPSFVKFLPDVLSFLTDTLRTLKNASDSFGQAVFKLLTEILTNFDKIELPTQFTRALVIFCGGQLDVHDSCDAVFDVLKLVMTRRKDIPEIYDQAQPALEIVIRALSPKVRKRAALFVSQFMSTYKMSEDRFRKLLKFALANLSSPKATGRRSLLTFLSHLIDECPMEEILDKYTELILVYLGARIANETDERIIPKLRKVIGKKLFLKVSPSRFYSMWNLMIKWCSSDGKQVRTGLLLLAVCVEYCASAFSNLFDSLQQVVEAHIDSENYKIKIAAVELHRQIVLANQSSQKENQNENEDENSFQLQLLSVDKLIELVKQKETTKTGCELLNWYLAEYFELFNPDDEGLAKISDEMINVIISYHAMYKEASESLYLALSNFKDLSNVNFFFDNNKEVIYSIFTEEFGSTSVEKTIIAIMRIFVLLIFNIVDENLINEDFDIILKNVLLFIWRAQEYSKDLDEEESKKKRNEFRDSTDKALESVRHKVDVDTFTRIWTSILEEDKERKKREMIERQVEEELEPEAYRKRVQEEREKKREEERRKRYLNDGQKATLHPFGIDGKRVESVPLAPEFQ